jgi:peptidyl-prolyl cis-trans isomerase C
MKGGTLGRSIICGLAGIAVYGLAGCGGEDEKKKGEEAEEAAGAEEEVSLVEQLGLTPEQAAKVVAKVGDREITVGDVTERINHLSPYIRRRWAAPERRKEFLQKLIRVELLSQEAERLGIRDDPEVQRTVKQVMIRMMVKNDLEKELLPTSIDEERLKKAYQEDHDKYHRPAQVRASQIVVESEAEAKKLIAELKKHSDDRRYFRERAKALSIDQKTKDRGGDLGYFSEPEKRREDEPEVPGAVARAAWSLKKVGEIADEPVETEAGFHVVKLTNKKPEMNRSFESVKRLIENRLLREERKEKMDEFVDKLRSEAKIDIIEENLEKVKIEPPNPKRHQHGSAFSADIPDAPSKDDEDDGDEKKAQGEAGESKGE